MRNLIRTYENLYEVMRKFIRTYENLYELVRKNVRAVWNESEQKSVTNCNQLK